MALIVRFPDGTKEFAFPEKLPEEGVLVRHGGELYRVLSISTDGGHATAVVELHEPGIGDILGSEEGALVLVELEEPEIVSLER